MSAPAAGRYVGQSIHRKEDPRLLTGHGRYIDDIVVPRMLHATFVRSDLPSAVITSIDVSAALELEGVVAVLTGADLNPGAGTLQPSMMAEDPNAIVPPLKPLAEGDVRFVGDPVAVVIAESRAVAEDGAELVFVDFDMPDMNGLEVVSEAKLIDAEAGRHVMYVCLTGGGPEITDESAGAAGFNRLLYKPLKVTDLLAVLLTARPGNFVAGSSAPAIRPARPAYGDRTPRH